MDASWLPSPPPPPSPLRGGVRGGGAARPNRTAPKQPPHRLSTAPPCDNFNRRPIFGPGAAIGGTMCDIAKSRIPGLSVKNFRLYDDPARPHAQNAWLACLHSGCAPGNPGLYPSSQRPGLSSLPLLRSSVPSLEAAMLSTLAPLSPRAGPYFFRHRHLFRPMFRQCHRMLADYAWLACPIRHCCGGGRSA